MIFEKKNTQQLLDAMNEALGRVASAFGCEVVGVTLTGTFPDKIKLNVSMEEFVDMSGVEIFEHDDLKPEWRKELQARLPQFMDAEIADFNEGLLLRWVGYADRAKNKAVVLDTNTGKILFIGLEKAMSMATPQNHSQ